MAPVLLRTIPIDPLITEAFIGRQTRRRRRKREGHRGVVSKTERRQRNGSLPEAGVMVLPETLRRTLRHHPIPGRARTIRQLLPPDRKMRMAGARRASAGRTIPQQMWRSAQSGRRGDRQAGDLLEHGPRCWSPQRNGLLRYERHPLEERTPVGVLVGLFHIHIFIRILFVFILTLLSYVGCFTFNLFT